MGLRVAFPSLALLAAWRFNLRTRVLPHTARAWCQRLRLLDARGVAMILSTQMDAQGNAVADPDEALSTRLRDLALVHLDALTVGLDGAAAQALAGAYADDCADALREARARMVVLKKELAGPDPLNVLDLQARQRASDAGQAGAARTTERLRAQAEAGRALARLADLASGLVPKLFEADRRR